MITAERVQKYRNTLREAGLRPIQLWVYDTRKPNFADECKKQCLVVAEADKIDNIHQFMDEAVNDIEGWTD